MRKERTLIIFQDTEQTKRRLLELAGPYGNLSKAARAAIREGIKALEKRGDRQAKEAV